MKFTLARLVLTMEAAAILAADAALRRRLLDTRDRALAVLKEISCEHSDA